MCFKKSKGIIKKTKFRKVAQITVICRFYCPHTHTTLLCTRYRLRFFDQVGHQTTSAYIENNNFSLNKDPVRLTKFMNSLVKDLKILSFKVIFSGSKIGLIFPKKICKEYLIRRPTYISEAF